MQSRWWRFLLYTSGTITMLYGTFTNWVDDGSFRLQDHAGGALFGLASWLTAVGGFVVIGWSTYNALVYTKRAPPASPAIAKVAIATAVIAAVGLVTAVVLTIAAYKWLAPSTLVEAPERMRRVTTSPWLALEGCASIVIGALSLWRAERRRAQGL